MPPRRNAIHATPPKAHLKRLQMTGTLATPLVKKARNANGQVYYPVFLPFDARVICPWCYKEWAVSTYATHTSGPRRCKKFPTTLSVPQMQENVPVAGEELDEEEEEDLDEEDIEEEDKDNEEDNDQQESLRDKMVQAFSDFLQQNAAARPAKAKKSTVAARKDHGKKITSKKKSTTTTSKRSTTTASKRSGLKKAGR